MVGLVIAALLLPASTQAYPAWWKTEAACVHRHEGSWHETTSSTGAPSRDHGGYQIDVATWARFAPAGWPSDPAWASPAEQTLVAWRIWVANGRRFGGNQWPTTARLCQAR